MAGPWYQMICVSLAAASAQGKRIVQRSDSEEIFGRKAKQMLARLIVKSGPVS
jgi:hypothetical protein